MKRIRRMSTVGSDDRSVASHGRRMATVCRSVASHGRRMPTVCRSVASHGRRMATVCRSAASHDRRMAAVGSDDSTAYQHGGVFIRHILRTWLLAYPWYTC